MKDRKEYYKEYEKNNPLYGVRFKKNENLELLELFKLSKEEEITHFIKKSCLYGADKYKDKHNEIVLLVKTEKEKVKLLMNLSRNINQIAAKLNSVKGISEAEKMKILKVINETKIEITKNL